MNKLIDSAEIILYIPIDTKIAHFEDVLPSQSLGFVQTKLNITQHKQACTCKPKDTVTQNKR